MVNNSQYAIQTLQTILRTKTSDQLSQAVADLSPAKPKLVDTFLERNIPQTAQNINVCLFFGGKYRFRLYKNVDFGETQRHMSYFSNVKMQVVKYFQNTYRK